MAESKLVHKAYKVRLYPNGQQVELMRKTFGCCRYVYNHALAVRKDAYKSTGLSLSGNDCKKLLPQMEADDPWLKEVDSTALQASIEDMDARHSNASLTVAKQAKKLDIRALSQSGIAGILSPAK